MLVVVVVFFFSSIDIIKKVLTRETFYHNSYEIAKMFFHLPNAGVVFVCFGFEI